MLEYENLVASNQDAFIAKVIDISTRLNINPNWLMGVMYVESRLNPTAQNPITFATGLIQFMPNTAKSLGTTIEAIRAMSNVQQLDYVYKYLLPYSGKIKSFSDCYFAVFFPAAIGKADTWVLQAVNLTAAKIAAQNPLYDVGKKGYITVADVKSKLPTIDDGKKKV